MSTFNGLVAEFPDIRIDFFRKHVNRRPPLACFLSHVHSDHLAGLEGLRSPFVYCSAATREILLRLERYPCRIIYARRILEARVQTYKHLKKLLRPLPLDSPTTLELAPGNLIQVTLLDANHCPGSVMFLIEDSNCAILYTGDIRSEPWFVNALVRNPAIIEYASGIKTLDRIYLDTSFIQNVPFQTKADGLSELLRKVALYPDNTIFHIQTWTYGYEQVWIALSKALKSRIHVDDYKMQIFSALAPKFSNDRFNSTVHLCQEAPALVGYICGNTHHPGCLTRDEHVRLHSCERANLCSVARSPNVVSIQPIVAHLADGGEITEAGVGGGGDDLERDAELDVLSPDDIYAVLALLEEKTEISQPRKSTIRKFLQNGVQTGRNLSLDLDIGSVDEKNMAAIVDVFQSIAQKEQRNRQTLPNKGASCSKQLPKTITFPYARHSSYQELCDLVRAFQPRDIWPCTVNISDWVKDNVTIRSLFGSYCSGESFEHDQEIVMLIRQNPGLLDHGMSQDLDYSQHTGDNIETSPLHCSHEGQLTEFELNPGNIRPGLNALGAGSMGMMASIQDQPHLSNETAQMVQNESVSDGPSRVLLPSCNVSKFRADAYLSMTGNLFGDEWTAIGLLSTSDHHTTPDEDLGEPRVSLGAADGRTERHSSPNHIT
ncbi:DNA repair protein [Colletotrichum truncatum]|uniref:DNA repair protein n=1 Tax=Colletotrichum truncatum TaxID=5467 RepID=A0ACC3ZDE3_COLTU|nr:DNA repair protein [Colletotrichum truncatum]KAF6798050.1 DNA repair protein [Colletotrichum truncatum]